MVSFYSGRFCYWMGLDFRVLFIGFGFWCFIEGCICLMIWNPLLFFESAENRIWYLQQFLQCILETVFRSFSWQTLETESWLSMFRKRVPFDCCKSLESGVCFKVFHFEFIFFLVCNSFMDHTIQSISFEELKIVFCWLSL